MDPDAVAKFIAGIAASRAEPPAKRGRAKKPSKLAERVRREEDAFHYGDGRRRRSGQAAATVQLNFKVPMELKLVIQTLAQKKRVGMTDIITEAVYLLQEQDEKAIT
jgi:hypothetical protein